MTKDEIQFWMLIAFAVASSLGFYKVYFLFNAPAKGIDINTQYNQLEDIIIDFLKQSHNKNFTPETLFQALIQLKSLDDDSYKNFNQNRCNQLLQSLFYTYKVENLQELIERIHHLDEGNG